MTDPSMMTDMLKKNLNMIVPQMLTAAWVNFFFTGFVVGKVPFPLTQRFRGMLQRGYAHANNRPRYYPTRFTYPRRRRAAFSEFEAT